MDANAQYELYQIKTELQSIIDELYNISGGIKSDFEGIGNIQCSNSIINVIKQCETAKTKLNSMNLNAVTEEFAARQQSEAEAKAKAEAHAKVAT